MEPAARALFRAAVRAVHPDRFAAAGGGAAATNARSLQVREKERGQATVR